jgi:septum formation inhibitor-activating ATPase MinD
VTLLKSYDLKEISFVANMVRGELLAAGECLSPREMENLLKIPLLGVVGEERELYVNEISENIRAFRVLASNLLTGKRKILDVTAPYTGAIGGLRRFLKKSL